MLFNHACERATGFRRDDVLGRPLVDFAIPQEEQEAFRELLALIWRTGYASPQVGHWLTVDGGRRLIAWSNNVVPSVGDAPPYLLTTGIDITDRPQTTEEPALADDPEAKLAEVGQLAQEQRSLRRVATLVASEASPEQVFAAVSEESARVLEVNASFVWRYEGDDTATIVGRYNRDGIESFPLGTRLYADGETTAIGRVRETSAPARVDDRGGADRRRGEPVGRRRDRECRVASRRGRSATRRLLRARLARGRERPGSRGPAGVPRAHRP